MNNPEEHGDIPSIKPKLSSIRIAGDYSVELNYSDGASGILDFSDYVGKGVFKKWQEKEKFKLAHIGEDGQLEWDQDIDFCPDALYLKITGKKPQDIFQNLNPDYA